MSEAPPGAVLFVCTANALRSAMAEGLMLRRFGPLTRAESAGVAPAEAVDAMAAAVMDELGVDISAHVPRDLAELDVDAFDLVITLSPEAHHHMLEVAPKVEYWPTFDPALAEGSREQRLLEYRTVRDGLDRRIAARFERPSTG